MSISPPDIEQTVIAFLTRANKMRTDFSADMPLYADGVGLDSLETAELSAVLEDEHGSDPFTASTMPQTLNDIQAFYSTVAVAEV
jgi:acyl carrier protein